MSDEEESEFSDIEEKISASKAAIENKIKWISLVLVTLCVFQWYTEGPTIIFNLKYFLRSFDFSMLIFLAPAFVLPVATYLFWKKRRAGWTFLVGILSFTLATIVLFVLIDLFNTFSTTTVNSSSSISGGAIIVVVILCSALWYIMKPDLRSYFDIGLKSAKITMLSSAILSLILVLLT